MTSIGVRLAAAAVLLVAGLVFYWRHPQVAEFTSPPPRSCPDEHINLRRVPMYGGAVIDLRRIHAVHLVYEPVGSACLLTGVRGAQFTYVEGELRPEPLAGRGMGLVVDFGVFPPVGSPSCTEANGFCLPPGRLPSIRHVRAEHFFNFPRYHMKMSYLRTSPGDQGYELTFFLQDWPRWDGDPSRAIDCHTTGVDWQRLTREQIEAFDFSAMPAGSHLEACVMNGWDFTYARGRGLVVFQKIDLAQASAALRALSRYLSAQLVTPLR